MNKQTDSVDQDDVVIIEERDKHTLKYILVAAALGIAIGGLLGSIATKSNWESAYQRLEKELTDARDVQVKAISQREATLQNKAEELEQEVARLVEEKVSLQSAKIEQENQQTVDNAESMVTELEKVNLELEKQVEEQSNTLKENTLTIAKLENQLNMQSNMFARSRELFQRELLIKQDLERLQKERIVLEPNLVRYKKECDLYLDGTSFEAKASSCDKQDETNSAISQIDQMIEVHKLDLREIQSISDSMGL